MHTSSHAVTASVMTPVLFLITVLGMFSSPETALGLVTRSVNLYQRSEEVMTNTTTFANPFTDTELRLSVVAPSGRPLGSSFTWYGFYDGNGAGGQTGNVWKFRMLFDYPGTWTVTAGFYVPGSSTRNGPTETYVYTVSSTKVSGEHGHVYVDPQNRMRFKHADGTPWVPFVFHSPMLLDRANSISRQWIDEHATRGIDALNVGFHTETTIHFGEPGYWHYLLRSGQRATVWPSAGLEAFDYNRFDLASWKKNEEVIEYAQSRGIKLSIWFGMSGLNPQYESYGPTDYPSNTALGPQQKLTIKYFLARWATYTNWWHWAIDSEYEETGSGALERVRAYAAEMNAKNPWKTLLTTHVLSNWTPGTAPEFQLATLQRRVANTDVGATDSRSFIYDNDNYNKPVYNAEGIWSLSNTTRVRIATWTHLMSGGFSNVAHLASDHTISSWGVNWNTVTARHREDVVEVGRIANFINKTADININRATPSTLATVSGGNLALTLAEPGEKYYVWVDGGGTVSLNLSGVSGTFLVKRYRGTDLGNPVTLADVAGGGTVSLGTTPESGFGRDYLFVLTRTEGATPPPTPSTCTNQQTSTASIPTGYGASYNPLTSAREYLVQASCTGTTQATVTAGNGNPLTYVYNRGYYWTGSTWTPYTLTCASGALISGAWCPGRATASIPLPQNPTNVIAYTCQYTNSTWKCGCRDATCSTAYWQLQRIQR